MDCYFLALITHILHINLTWDICKCISFLDHTNIMWNKTLFLKVSLFAWRIFDKNITVIDNLLRRRVVRSGAKTCARCYGKEESINHMFLGCKCFGSIGIAFISGWVFQLPTQLMFWSTQSNSWIQLFLGMIYGLLFRPHGWLLFGLFGKSTTIALEGAQQLFLRTQFNSWIQLILGMKYGLVFKSHGWLLFGRSLMSKTASARFYRSSKNRVSFRQGIMNLINF